MNGAEAYLTVEKGEPYKSGYSIKLLTGQILLGRSWQSYEPDIAFTSMLISRRHAVISWRDNAFYVTDMASKHGTQVNGLDIPSDEHCLLRHGDKITLARGTVVLVFNNPSEDDDDNTVDFTGMFPGETPPAVSGLVVKPERREVQSDGMPLNLSGKDLELLLLLYRNRGRAVSYDDIKTRVWSERAPDASDGVPDVGNDEITALVYRLRKRLGIHGDKIVSVPRFGYMLDL